MTEPTRSEWHARIEAAPDDLELREVFADWLLAQGDPLGELIQTECTLLRDPKNKKRRAMQLRAVALKTEHGAAFFGAHHAKAETRGGMIERVRGGFWKNHKSIPELDELLAHSPALTHLQLETCFVQGDEQDAIVRHPLWQRPRELEVRGRAANALRLALEAQELPRLEVLRVEAMPAEARPLLASLVAGRAPKLRRLELPTSSWTQEMGINAQDLALIARLPGLGVLDLYGNDITADSMRTLATGTALSGITELRIGRTQLGLEGLAALAESKHLGTLHTLDMRRANIRGKGPIVAAAPAAFAAATPELRALEMMQTRLTPEAIALFARPDVWPKLEELSVQGCALDDAGLVRVLAGKRELRVLNLRSNALTDDALATLAKAKLDLVLLNLEGNKLTPDAVKKLAQSLPRTVVTFAAKASSLFGSPHHEKHGLQLGSTIYRAQDVVKTA